jgi:hypothetical protein
MLVRTCSFPQISVHPDPHTDAPADTRYTMGQVSQKPARLLDAFARKHPADALRAPAGRNLGKAPVGQWEPECPTVTCNTKRLLDASW